MRTEWNGRVHVADEQDANYPLRAALPPRGTARPDWRFWWSWGVEDQGATPRCVAFSGHSFLLDGPVRVRNVPDQATLYREAQLRDGIPGTDYDGTNSRGLMKYLAELGIVSEYRWAETIDDVIDCVSLVQPVLVGSDWDHSMDYPNGEGFLVPDGDVAGGHEWEVIGVSNTRRAFRMKNTWGRDWGDGGRAWIGFDEFEELVFGRGTGDVCIGTEAKLP